MGERYWMVKEKDPYKKVRRSIPPPSHPIGHGREYDKRLRKKKKEIIEEEIELNGIVEKEDDREA